MSAEREPYSVTYLLDRLQDFYTFECEGGPLANCREWKMLRELVERTPNASRDSELRKLAERWESVDRYPKPNEPYLICAKEMRKILDRKSDGAGEELAKVEKDATRYRWLREAAAGERVDVTVITPEDDVTCWREGLDDEIDAAIQAESGKFDEQE